MAAIETIPSQSSLGLNSKMIPGYMHPNDRPLAVVMPGLLSWNECDAIAEYAEELPSYQFGGCDALTRECPMPLDPVLNTIWAAGMLANEQYWQFDVNKSAGAWLQTYIAGQGYHTHTDAAAGQSRKLTAVAMLTDPRRYDGGALEILTFEKDPYVIDRTRGTVVVFPGWTVHQVSELSSDGRNRNPKRQTINMGWWGPPFK